MKRAFRVAALAWGGLILICLGSTATLACSPPFEEPTIHALGPDQIVIVGTLGRRVEGGRAFDVQRWFQRRRSRDSDRHRFKEGQPVGDCSYLVASGAELIIAPHREADGTLSANLATLQADPSSEEGQRYLAEATALFGAGVVPAGRGDADSSARFRQQRAVRLGGRCGRGGAGDGAGASVTREPRAGVTSSVGRPPRSSRRTGPSCRPPVAVPSK